MAAFAPEVQVEAIQSVTPFKVTDDPRDTRQVLVKKPVGWEIFQGCLNVILYYKQAGEEGSGWMVAGWIRESLSKALVEEPLLSGRMRRGEDGESELVIVANDSGARLVEGKIATTLEEFLGRKEREKLEAQLVYWKEFDEQDPQFTPLFYVQVTNFQCGGYSIGISCSLHLADLLLKGSFLQRWADVHKNVVSKNDGLKLPIFYLPNLKANGLLPTSAFWPTPIKNCGQSMVFRISGADFKNEACETLALLSIEEAESMLGNKLAPTFPLLVKESPKVMKVQICEKPELVESHVNLKSQVIASSWDDFEIKKAAFLGGNEASNVSCWIGSACNGLAMAIPSPGEGTSYLNIIVVIP